MKNFYEILNIKQSANSSDIKSAYLKLIKKYHPDTYAGDKNFAKEQTELITEAYATLKDEEKRKVYDLSMPKKETKTKKVNVENFMKKVKFVNEKTEEQKQAKTKKTKVQDDNSNEKPSTKKFDIAIIILALLLVTFLVLCFV